MHRTFPKPIARDPADSETNPSSAAPSHNGDVILSSQFPLAGHLPAIATSPLSIHHPASIPQRKSPHFDLTETIQHANNVDSRLRSPPTMTFPRPAHVVPDNRPPPSPPAFLTDAPEAAASPTARTDSPPLQRINTKQICEEHDTLRDLRDTLMGVRFQLQARKNDIRKVRAETGAREGAVIQQIRLFLHDSGLELPAATQKALDEVYALRDRLGQLEVDYGDAEERYHQQEIQYDEKELKFIDSIAADINDVATETKADVSGVTMADMKTFDGTSSQGSNAGHPSTLQVGSTNVTTRNAEPNVQTSSQLPRASPSQVTTSSRERPELFQSFKLSLNKQLLRRPHDWPMKEQRIKEWFDDILSHSRYERASESCYHHANRALLERQDDETGIESNRQLVGDAVSDALEKSSCSEYSGDDRSPRNSIMDIPEMSTEAGNLESTSQCAAFHPTEHALAPLGDILIPETLVSSDFLESDEDEEALFSNDGHRVDAAANSVSTAPQEMRCLERTEPDRLARCWTEQSSGLQDESPQRDRLYRTTCNSVAPFEHANNKEEIQGNLSAHHRNRPKADVRRPPRPVSECEQDAIDAVESSQYSNTLEQPRPAPDLKHIVGESDPRDVPPPLSTHQTISHFPDCGCITPRLTHDSSLSASIRSIEEVSASRPTIEILQLMPRFDNLGPRKPRMIDLDWGSFDIQHKARVEVFDTCVP
ncbi:hypothetical protein ACN47E_008671 [Coniothyrium glycines]